MRRYWRRLARALRVSVLVFGGLSLLVFFFDDGHRRPPVFAASAEANESLLPSQPIEVKRIFSPDDVALPEHFQAHWRKVVLTSENQNQMTLYQLEKPFHLKQTRHQLGSEYFDYAAFLFEQMGAQVQDVDLADRLNRLSMQAHTLGHVVDQVGDFAYDGPALENMAHVRVRTEIGDALDLLNTKALHTKRFNQDGQLLESSSSKAPNPGELLIAFQENLDSILKHPHAQQAPQVMQLLKTQGHLLEALATHVSLEWESTEASTPHGDKVLHVSIYARQTLSEKQIAATIQ